MEEKKFIKENSGEGPYSKEQCMDFCKRLVSSLTDSWSKGSEQFVKDFWKWKKKIQDLILYWNPELSVDFPGYGFLKNTLEAYWDYYVKEKDLEKFYDIVGKYDK